MQNLVSGLCVVTMMLLMSSCAGAPSGGVSSFLVGLEQAREFDTRATETCNGALDGSATLIATADTTAGEIRLMYEQGEVVDPSSVDVLPVDPRTYAAVCVYDARDVSEFPFEKVAYWVSSDSEVGGVVVLMAWDDDEL